MLDEIRKKVEAGERLSAADGEFLFSPEVDLHAVGELADVVRRRKNGNAAYYNLNLHINPTNVCIYRCALCAYSRDEDDPRAYTMSDERDSRSGQGGGRRRLHRTAHRRRRASARRRSTGIWASSATCTRPFPACT